ncbi:MAG: hypothetical protein R6V03_01410 [Kiritimatiellia bacterium]
MKRSRDKMQFKDPSGFMSAEEVTDDGSSQEPRGRSSAIRMGR